jgi:hypothetical protein
LVSIDALQKFGCVPIASTTTPATFAPVITIAAPTLTFLALATIATIASAAIYWALTHQTVVEWHDRQREYSNKKHQQLKLSHGSSPRQETTLAHALRQMCPALYWYSV